MPSFGGLLIVAAIAFAAPFVLLDAIALASTSLGVLIPVLRDAGQSGSTLGRLVIAAGSIADSVTGLALLRAAGGRAAREEPVEDAPLMAM